MDIKQAVKLLQRYREGNVTQSEKELVETWYRQLVETGELDWKEGEKEQIQHTLEAAILSKIQQGKQEPTVRHIHPRRWWVAASVVIVCSIAAYFLVFDKAPAPSQVATVTLPADVQAPQSNRALLKLANGKTVYLDSITNGAEVLQGDAKLVKLSNGEIVYEANETPGEVVQNNTLLNPRGSKVISILLSDGTKVWLNAGSSLVYPVAFGAATRDVSVTGEAYFEVAHNKQKQFIVHSGPVQVNVTGTHFNVNAFEDDDNNIKVTLLEGSVNVNNGKSNGSLKPGQQAWVHEKVNVKSNVNVEQVMAWKNGFFQFDKASLQSVLKQVARWYDVEVVYEGANHSREFVGEIERGLSLSEMLRILEVNKVSFTIEGKKLTIKPD